MVNFFYLDKDPKICAQYYCNKHVLKIPIEIGQILSKIHHELKSGADYSKLYKNSLVVKDTIGPYVWALESIDNYNWTVQLGLALIDEFKFRYNRDTHKTENIIKYLYNNPPNLPKIGITKFKITNKFDMFQYISSDPIICARYNYAEMKCANDKWTKRDKPDWFNKIYKEVQKKKKVLIKKIDKQVREILPSLVRKGDRVYRFHSFLRVSYDHLFQGKWNTKAPAMNKYDKSKPLLYQLTYPQLYYTYEIAKSIENKKILSLLNTRSLRYRKKLKFPSNRINYKESPECYLYTSNQNGALVVEPYKSHIFPYMELEAKESSTKIYKLFLEYIKEEDMVGADMARKYLQICLDKSIKKESKILFSNKLELINNNSAYNSWIEKFNWKKADPYKPKDYVL
jgi:hypothetical protein